MSSLRQFNKAMASQNASPTAGPSAAPPRLRLTDDEIEKIIGDEAADGVKRAKVQAALKRFLDDLAVAQKNTHNVVKSTDKVWQADMVLHEGLTDDAAGPFTPTGGDGKSYDTAELAARIAGQLPDTIPIANFGKFLKLKATDTALPGTITEQLHKKYEETRDRIVAKLPEKVRKLAKKAMDAAVAKGVSFVADAALKGAGLSADVEGQMKKAVDDYVKKVTGGGDGGGDQ